jgi:hypothetical protein
MDKFRFSVLALTFVAVSPAATLAGDDQDGLEGLDGTMIVLDNVLDLESAVNEMGEPDGYEVVNDDCDDDCNDEDESDERYEDELGGDFKKQFKGDDFIKNEDEMSEEDESDDRDDIDVDELREEDEDSID